MNQPPDDRAVARQALEEVCASGDMELAPACYAPDFADHVNGVDFHGLDGVRRSTGLYRALFDPLEIRVVDQVAERDRIANRWLPEGSIAVARSA